MIYTSVLTGSRTGRIKGTVSVISGDPPCKDDISVVSVTKVASAMLACETLWRNSSQKNKYIFHILDQMKVSRLPG